MRRYSSDAPVPEKIAFIESLKVDGTIKDILNEYVDILKKEIKDIDTVIFSERYEETFCCMGPDGAYHEITAHAKTGRYSREIMAEKFMEYIIENLCIEEKNYTKYLVVSYMDGERDLFTPLSKLKKEILKDMSMKDMPGGTTVYVFTTGGDDIEEFEE